MEEDGMYTDTSLQQHSFELCANMSRIKYATDVEKSVITNNFEARGWTVVHPDEDWNIFWASVQSIRMLFNNDTSYRLSDNQVFSILNCAN
ncbi:tubulin tyrosine ligase-related [Schistosoma mansoni]|uniref:tubulin tyrosine ligase-related n=1 Tax=Schistosoma mansoni TaxID=6183 RepID=UPI0001A6467E|nr:tubulin tyrosine ligase-related [Schistosoma mansoni]|eukprot:XP_018647096.1 tubulin tyrosine ligase-related [Schistosoma mansoni]